MIQCYGFISLEYNHDHEKLLNSTNRLSFKIKHNIKNEFITLQLEDILTPKKIETDDSKITNFSILSVEKAKEMQMQIMNLKLRVSKFSTVFKNQSHKYSNNRSRDSK